MNQPGIEAVEKVRKSIMRKHLVMAFGLMFVCATALAQGSGGPGDPQGDQIQQRDRLQTCSPELDQERTRLHQGLPADVQKAVQEMKQAREQYQQKLREKKKELSSCTEQERAQIREQLREMIKDQVRAREQLRERLRAMRDAVPTHQQVMEEAKERVRERDRRGE